jgi:hypothetical protein
VESLVAAEAARRQVVDLTASAAKATANAAHWGSVAVAQRVKAASLEIAAVAAKIAANLAKDAKDAAENLVSSQRVDCQKTQKRKSHYLAL